MSGEIALGIIIAFLVLSLLGGLGRKGPGGFIRGVGEGMPPPPRPPRPMFGSTPEQHDHRRHRGPH